MATDPTLAAVKVVLLCGGLGTRMREETEFRPKPMVEVGGRPLLWHVMKLYAHHGFRDFVLCLGYKGALIKEYFANYHVHNSDVTFDLARGDIEYHRGHAEDWRVTLVDTGADAMTGARVKRVEHHARSGELFLCTYGDGVSDVDVTKLVAFHRAHGKLATVTGVPQPSRFGVLVSDADGVVETFAEKPTEESAHINGGFFVFDAAVFDRLSADPSCILEREPLEQLSADGQLVKYQHDGYWQCADTVRDVDHLRSLWDSGQAPWRVWDDRRRNAGDGEAHGRRAEDWRAQGPARLPSSLVS